MENTHMTLDTIIISSCKRFVVHIYKLSVNEDKWIVLENGRIYKIKSYAIDNGRRYIKKLKKKYPKKVKRRRKIPAGGVKIITHRRRTIPAIKHNCWTQVNIYNVKF